MKVCQLLLSRHFNEGGGLNILMVDFFLVQPKPSKLCFLCIKAIFNLRKLTFFSDFCLLYKFKFFPKKDLILLLFFCISQIVSTIIEFLCYSNQFNAFIKPLSDIVLFPATTKFYVFVKTTSALTTLHNTFHLQKLHC